MPEPLVTVAVATLAADDSLAQCVVSLIRQTLPQVDIVVIDNSGKGRVRQSEAAHYPIRIIENQENVGFGAAINQGFAGSTAPYLACLNDDAVAAPDWLAHLVAAMAADHRVGMCASRVLLGPDGLDSAGMLLCPDGVGKQRGHGEPPHVYARPGEVLLPSGSAALYRRDMLAQIGGFDEEFFLYCEDTDLGLRARWAGWTCRYVPEAVVEHRWSHSAGRASPLKAYYVERNRLFVAAKNFPPGMLAALPLRALERYCWHAWFLLFSKGTAAQYQGEGHGFLTLAYLIFRAHLSALFRLPRLLRQRRVIQAGAKLRQHEFELLVQEFGISPRQVAEQ